MLILNNQKCISVPICECGSYMIPKGLVLGKGWKCPGCGKEKNEGDE